MLVFAAVMAIVSNETARSFLEATFAEASAVVADHLFTLMGATIALAALCLVGCCLRVSLSDERGSGSKLQPVEHWSARGDGRPARHGKVHHKLEHNWELRNARETLRGGEHAALEATLTGSLVGRQVWVCTGVRDASKAAPRFVPAENPNAGDKLWRTRADGASHRDAPRRAKHVAAITRPEDALRDALGYYQRLQAVDGHFPGDYGGPFFLMPGLIITLHVATGGTALSAERKSAMLTYLRNHQQVDGGWGLHVESPSTMFGTVMNYVSARLLGLAAGAPECKAARAFIQKHGGAVGIPSWGKFWLALLNVYSWDGLNPIPPELWALPYAFPFHPGRLWCHARMVYLPMSYLFGRRCTAPVTPITTELRDELYVTPYADIDWDAARNFVCPLDLYASHPKLLVVLNKLLVLYYKLPAWGPLRWWRERAVRFAIEYVCAEDVQTNYVDIGPVNKSLNMLSVFYEFGADSPQFQRHLARVDDYLWVAEDGMKMNGYNGSQLWDTAFAGQALLESGLAHEFKACTQGIHEYVDATQVKEDVPMRARFYRHISKGGWPFSTADHGWPISDCTAEGLKVSIGMRHLGFVKDTLSDERMANAVNVILSFQNGDGGWATYENTRGWRWFEQLNPAEVFGDIMIDYSYVECSSASVTALVAFRNECPDVRRAEVDEAIRRGGDFIARVQRPDGSWYGSWGICFTYGTWFGIEGLMATGRDPHGPELTRAREFLLSKQRPDGGWGESYLSCVTRKYHDNAQEGSTVVNTAWALLGLMAAHEPKRDAVERGIKFLIGRQLSNGDWAQESVSGVFNRTCGITYTAYRNVFPLWALGRFTNEYAHAVPGGAVKGAGVGAGVGVANEHAAATNGHAKGHTNGRSNGAGRARSRRGRGRAASGGSN